MTTHSPKRGVLGQLVLQLVLLLSSLVTVVSTTFASSSGIQVKFGLSTQGINFNGTKTVRDPLSAQHIRALVLALRDIQKTNRDLRKDFEQHKLLPAGEKLFDLQLMSYQGNQISSGTSQTSQNEFFDGAFGAFTIGHDVVGNIDADLNIEKAKSMTATFDGWRTASLMVSSQDTSFSHGTDYPLKARLIPSDNLLAIPLVPILQAYNFNRLGVFYSTDLVGTDLHKNLLRTLSTTTLTGSLNSGIGILFEAQVPPAMTDFTALLSVAKDSGTTIFVLLLGNEKQALLLQQGFEQGVFVTGTQTIGMGISNDDPENGGRSIQDYLSSSGLNSAKIASIILGHMIFKFDPRVLFKTPAGQYFLSEFKAAPPTRKPSKPGFAPKMQQFLDNKTVQGWPIGARWFMDECRVWDEMNGRYFNDSMDTGRPFLEYFIGTAPGNTGFLYANIDVAGGSQKSSVFSVNTSTSKALFFDDVRLKGLRGSQLTYFDGTANNPSISPGHGDAGTFWPCGDPDGSKPCMPIPLQGTCLGMSQEDLDGVAADGSSGIDWRTLYVYDAIMIVFNNAVRFLSSQLQSGNTFANDAEFSSKLREYFNTVIPSNIKDGRQVSTPQPLPLTGQASFHAGFPLDDNFMLGDRVSGFPFSMNQFSADSGKFEQIGYWDPELETYKQCGASNTVGMLQATLSCRQPVYRTVDNLPPLPMQPTVFLTFPSSFTISVQFFGSLALISTVAFMAAVGLYWNHPVLKMRQQLVLVCILVGELLGCIKVLSASKWAINETSCNADYWLEHICFRIITFSLLSKLWRLNKIFNNNSFKRVRVTEAAILTSVGIATFTCVVVLALASGLGGSRVMTFVSIQHNQQLVTTFCGIPHTLPSVVLHAVLFVFQSGGLLAALYYSWKTRNVPPVVNEASILIPQLAMTFFIAVVAGSLLLVYDPEPMVYQLVINLIFALAICLGNFFYFFPVISAVILHDKKKNEAKEASMLDSSTAMTSTTMSDSQLSTSDSAASATDVKARRASEGGASRRRGSVPAGVDLTELHDDLAQELLRSARGADRKAMLCQEMVLFWRTQMLKVEENANSSSDGSKTTAASTVYVSNDEDDQELDSPSALEKHSRSVANEP